MAITDRESAKAWLMSQERDVIVAVAARCAQRAAAFLIYAIQPSDDQDAILTLSLRSNVTSAVASKWQTLEATRAAFSAADADADANAYAYAFADTDTVADAAARAAARAAIFASFAGADDGAFGAYDDAASAADAAADAAFDVDYRAADTAAIWEALSSDAAAVDAGASTATLLNRPLWTEVSHIEDKAKAFISYLETAPNFTFWARWYRGALEGRPLNWDLQRAIALEIEDEDWKAGPARVAERIAAIEARFLDDAAPLAEAIEVNPETGLIRAVPIPLRGPPNVSLLLSQVKDAMDIALANPRNGLREITYPLPLLRLTIDKYANDPQRVEMNCVRAAMSLRRQIEQTQDLPDNEENLALLDCVEEAARGVRAAHPEVAQVRETLAKQALKELPEEDKAKLIEAQPVLSAMSEGDVREDYESDIPELVATRDPFGPSTAPPLPGLDPAARVFSRVAKTSLLLRGAREAIDAVSKSTGMKAAGILATLEAVVRMGLRLFGII